MDFSTWNSCSFSCGSGIGSGTGVGSISGSGSCDWRSAAGLDGRALSQEGKEA